MLTCLFSALLLWLKDGCNFNLSARLRNLSLAHARVKLGDYELSGLIGCQLEGKTIGVIGTGAVGAEAVRIFKVSELARVMVQGLGFQGVSGQAGRGQHATDWGFGIDSSMMPAYHHELMALCILSSCKALLLSSYPMWLLVLAINKDAGYDVVYVGSWHVCGGS